MKTASATDYYRILGVSQDATPEEIRTAYRRRVRHNHPDLVADENEDTRRSATERTARLNEAYACLNDPDRRTAYDRARAASAATPGSPLPGIHVSPASMRCEIDPGDTVRLVLDVRADGAPDWQGLDVGIPGPLAAKEVDVTPLSATTAQVNLRLDTTRLVVQRIYRIPIVVSGGGRHGTATLAVHTTKGATRRSRHLWRHPSDRRLRDLVTACLGGIAVPLLVLAWAWGLLAMPRPPNPELFVAIAVGVTVLNTWLLASTRLMREPGRLPRWGAVWVRLMRWSGWGILGMAVVLLGIPLAMVVIGVVSVVPLLGFAIFAAFIDSRDR